MANTNNNSAWRSAKKTNTNLIREIVFVDPQFLGRLFGKGGQRLQDLRAKHGDLINIKVARQNTEDGMRRVTISTRKDSWLLESHARTACKNAAKDCLKAAQPPRRRSKKSGSYSYNPTVAIGVGHSNVGDDLRPKVELKERSRKLHQQQPTNRKFQLAENDFPALGGAQPVFAWTKKKNLIVADLVAKNLLTRTGQQNNQYGTSGA